jgi:hypothetical protein
MGTAIRLAPARVPVAGQLLLVELTAIPTGGVVYPGWSFVSAILVPAHDVGHGPERVQLIANFWQIRPTGP